MNGSYLKKILNINAKHALYREDGKWYHNLKEFPGVLFDKNGFVIFNTQSSYIKHPNLQIKKDLHVLHGISGISEYQLFTSYQRKLIRGVAFDEIFFSEGPNEVLRVVRELNTILRKRSLVEKIKKLYNNTCQICGTKLKIGNDQFYSEVHHIVPLGYPYNGKDTLANMICVCPNHHTLLDFKSIPLDVSSFKFNRHEISHDFVNSHNSLFRVRNGI